MAKVIYLANVRLPTVRAHGLQIMKTSEALAQEGADLTLVVPKRYRDLATDPFDYYRVKRLFTIRKLSTVDLTHWGKLGGWAQTLIFSFKSAWYVRNQQVAVVYSRDPLPLLLTALITPSKKYFWEAHDGKNNWLIQRLIERLAGLVVISNGLRDFYIKKGLNPSKILVAPDAVDLDFFTRSLSSQEARVKLGLPLNKKIIMYTGQLFRWKGVDTLGKAAALLSDQALVVLVGGTAEQVADFRQRYPATNILLVGAKPHTEVPPYLWSADVLVLPNSAQEDISRLYTSPMKLFEYLASGTPIIASDLLSLKEILHSKNSLLVPADNPQALALGIRELLSNRTLGEKLAQVARAEAENYTWHHRAERVLRFLNR